MAYFAETIRAVSSLPPNLRLTDGNHLERREVVGRNGDVVEDRPFIFGQDLIQDINPTSLIGEVLGMEHVRQVHPGRRLMTNIIVDKMDSRDDDRIQAKKEIIAVHIAATLFASMAQTSDSVKLMVRQGMNLGDISPTATKLTWLEDDASVQEASSKGISFLINDFARFDTLDEANKPHPVIGVKVNHPLERNIPSGIGLLGLGNGYELDTSNPKELDEINQRLQVRHRSIVEAMKQTGIRIANVIIEPQFDDGFNPVLADHHISTAVKSLKSN